MRRRVASSLLVVLLMASLAPAAARRKSRRAPVKKSPPVSAKARAQAAEAVNQALSAPVPIEGAAALVPFFELLYRQQRRELDTPLRVLQFGDSHTAAD